jgi:O-antigen ligase
MIRRIVDDPGFFLVEFICLILAVMLLNYVPGINWQPLLIAVVPIVLRFSSGKSPIVRTQFDLPMGIWAAYQPAGVLTKFWLILASVLFYYLLVRQPIDNLWTAAGIICLIFVGFSLYSFLSNHWTDIPQQILRFSQKILTLLRIRPASSMQEIYLNDIVDAIDLVLPFSIALTIHCWRRKAHFRSFLFGLATCFILATILVSESKSAWIALSGVAGLWLLWKICGVLARKLPLSRRSLFILSFGFLTCLTVALFWSNFYTKLGEVAIGGTDTSELSQRLHLDISAIQLIQDSPFTGGGLNGFPGLYSSYILNTPNFIVNHSHNIYFDVSIEQGILGGLMLIWIYLGSIFLMTLQPISPTHTLLHKAVLASLLIIVIHGLLDTTIYNTALIPLLFFGPGMAVGLVALENPLSTGFRWDKLQFRHRTILIVIAFGIILIGIFAFYRPLLSSWYTDLGAVEMAKVELSDFPTGRWDEGQHVDLLSPAKSLLDQALYYEPTNPGANYRLGLIAMLKRDYPAAVSYLEIAHRSDPYHRGILKSLGLSYIWNGQIKDAISLLSLLPESNQELAIYPWWWREQNRQDLAANAEEYLKMVGSGQ